MSARRFNRDLVTWMAAQIRQWGPEEAARKIRQKPTYAEITRAEALLEGGALAIEKMLEPPPAWERIACDLAWQLEECQRQLDSRPSDPQGGQADG